MKRENFLKDVRHEIDMLKEHATPEEKGRLDLTTFDAEKTNTCIYGQLTKSCTSDRARFLMDKACVRVMDLSDENEPRSGGVETISGREIEDPRFNINGDYKAQTWDLSGDYRLRNIGRNYKYLSALEAYICTKNANTSGVISYLKGETQELLLN